MLWWFVVAYAFIGVGFHIDLDSAVKGRSVPSDPVFIFLFAALWPFTLLVFTGSKLSEWGRS